MVTSLVIMAMNAEMLEGVCNSSGLTEGKGDYGSSSYCYRPAV